MNVYVRQMASSQAKTVTNIPGPADMQAGTAGTLSSQQMTTWRAPPRPTGPWPERPGRRRHWPRRRLARTSHRPPTVARMNLIDVP